VVGDRLRGGRRNKPVYGAGAAPAILQLKGLEKSSRGGKTLRGGRNISPIHFLRCGGKACAGILKGEKFQRKGTVLRYTSSLPSRSSTTERRSGGRRTGKINVFKRKLRSVNSTEKILSRERKGTTGSRGDLPRRGPREAMHP